jgi:hypothetical protein
MTMLSLVTGETTEIEFLPLDEETTDKLTAEEIDSFLAQLREEPAQ